MEHPGVRCRPESGDNGEGFALKICDNYWLMAANLMPFAFSRSKSGWSRPVLGVRIPARSGTCKPLAAKPAPLHGFLGRARTWRRKRPDGTAYVDLRKAAVMAV